MLKYLFILAILCGVSLSVNASSDTDIFCMQDIICMTSISGIKCDYPSSPGWVPCWRDGRGGCSGTPKIGTLSFVGATSVSPGMSGGGICIYSYTPGGTANLFLTNWKMRADQNDGGSWGNAPFGEGLVCNSTNSSDCPFSSM